MPVPNYTPWQPGIGSTYDLGITQIPSRNAVGNLAYGTAGYEMSNLPIGGPFHAGIASPNTTPGMPTATNTVNYYAPIGNSISQIGDTRYNYLGPDPSNPNSSSQMGQSGVERGSLYSLFGSQNQSHTPTSVQNPQSPTPTQQPFDVSNLLNFLPSYLNQQMNNPFQASSYGQVGAQQQQNMYGLPSQGWGWGS